MVELIEQSKLAVDELIDVLGRASIEGALQLSAQSLAGPPRPGKKYCSASHALNFRFRFLAN